MFSSSQRFNRYIATRDCSRCCRDSLRDRLLCLSSAATDVLTSMRLWNVQPHCTSQT
ncbi:hypothetical protein WG66_006471 [Moniliophthora roreri]|nr:hypothetical protein WG66_006471 [Moniliophthora roreri]